jgi:hypothetical protein
MAMEYSDHLEVLASIDRDLARKLSDCISIEQVLPWMQRQGLDGQGLDVVAQDEYSHDLLVPLSDGRYVVFGMT